MESRDTDRFGVLVVLVLGVLLPLLALNLEMMYLFSHVNTPAVNVRVITIMTAGVNVSRLALIYKIQHTNNQ